MKLKKYNEYVKEELTPMMGELEETDLETPEVSDMESDLDTEVPSEEVINTPTEEEEEGSDVDNWKGDQLLQQFAELMGVEVVDNHVNIDGHVVTFAPETETFLINRKNTKVSDPHELVHKEFKGHEHKH